MLRAVSLDAGHRALLPSLFARLQASPKDKDMAAVISDELRSGGDAAREALQSMAKALGSREILPPGPVGAAAKAFTDRLAELLVAR